MASFEVAFNWMMDNEDASRAYKTVPDTGGMAISGINSAAYPSDFARINAIQQGLRGRRSRLSTSRISGISGMRRSRATT